MGRVGAGWAERAVTRCAPERTGRGPGQGLAVVVAAGLYIGKSSNGSPSNEHKAGLSPLFHSTFTRALLLHSHAKAGGTLAESAVRCSRQPPRPRAPLRRPRLLLAVGAAGRWALGTRSSLPCLAGRSSASACLRRRSGSSGLVSNVEAAMSDGKMRCAVSARTEHKARDPRSNHRP